MFDKEKGRYKAFSFSGGERNRLFIQKNGRFDDVSLVSGVDFTQDGRCFALFDYDLDGFEDLAVMSTTEPKIRLLRNELAESASGKTSNWIRIKLVGGNNRADSSSKLSSRQPFNAIIDVETNGVTRRFRYAPFDGLNNQNSERLHIGLGEKTLVDRIKVYWPSGKVTIRNDIPSGKLETILETE